MRLNHQSETRYQYDALDYGRGLVLRPINLDGNNGIKRFWHCRRDLTGFKIRAFLFRLARNIVS